MPDLRLIARLDIKAPNLIKGIHLEGLRKIGNPAEFAKRYYQAGIDEIIYMDIVATLYQRNNLSDILRDTTESVFIPITAGGGVRTLQDVETMMRCGADKVAINTAAVKRPRFIEEVATRFGSQCCVLSVEAKQSGPSRWEAYTDNGREHTGLDVVEWVRQAAELGAGEVLLTSVDREGTRKGFDLALTRSVADAVSIPVIASGGMGSGEHLIEVVREGHADAVAMADVLHYNRMPLTEIRELAAGAGIPVRSM